jgi:putative transposase
MDITYIPKNNGFMYLAAIIDAYSRYTDQGSQFTSDVFTGYLLGEEIKVSMDGRGRATDNIYIERLWRSVKQEKSQTEFDTCLFTTKRAELNLIHVF